MVRSIRRLVASLSLASLITSCNAFSHPSSALLTARNRRNSGCSNTSVGPRFATTRLQQSAVGKQDEVDECPPGYYLDHVKERCNKLGPLGAASQVIERAGPLNRVYKKISTLFGIDPHRISKLGVAFALSYSVVSNINGSLSLSVAWYLSCTRTGLSPLAPGQWTSLLKAYGTIYAVIQLLRPFRVAAAIAMSKLSGEFLDQTQKKLDCSRGVAIFFQYALGWVVWMVLAALGIAVASWSSGVPLL